MDLSKLGNLPPLVLALMLGILLAWLAIKILEAKIPKLRERSEKAQSKRADSLSAIGSASTSLASYVEQMAAGHEEHIKQSTKSAQQVGDMHSVLINRVDGKLERAGCGARRAVESMRELESK